MKTINTCSLKVIAIKDENIRKMFLAVNSSRILYTKGTSRIPAGRVLSPDNLYGFPHASTASPISGENWKQNVMDNCSSFSFKFTCTWAQAFPYSFHHQSGQEVKAHIIHFPVGKNWKWKWKSWFFLYIFIRMGIK